MKAIVYKSDILPEFKDIPDDKLDLKHFNYNCQKVIVYVDSVIYHGENGYKRSIINSNVDRNKEVKPSGITHNASPLGGN